MKIVSTKTTRLKINDTPSTMLKGPVNTWHVSPDGFDFDVGEQSFKLHAALGPEALLSWLGGAEGLRGLSLHLGELEGSLEGPAAVSLHLLNSEGQSEQSVRVDSDGKRTRHLVAAAPPAGVRLSLRFEGRGLFRSVQVFIQTKTDDTSDPKDSGEHPARCVIIQGGFGSTPFLGAEDSVVNVGLALTPAHLREQLRATLIAAKMRSIRRLANRVESDLGELNQLIASPSATGSSTSGPKSGRSSPMRPALETCFASVVAARESIKALERRVFRQLGQDGMEDPFETIADATRAKLSADTRADLARQAADLVPTKGLLSAIATCMNSSHSADHSALLQHLGESLATADLDATLQCYWLSYALNPTPQRAASLATKMFKAGDITDAGVLLDRSEPDPEKESLLLRALQAAARTHRHGVPIPPRSEPAAPPREDIAYVASSAQPFQFAGYTIRTQELLAALQRKGLRVRCYIRPGYPQAKLLPPAEAAALAEAYRVEDVDYRLVEPGRADHSVDYFEAAAALLLERFRERPPRIVHAASNYRNAIPALIAARRLGVPFVYEVRGLWELTAASRNPVWDQTERFKLERDLEFLAASSADKVLCITRGVAEEFITAGVPEAKIALLPNGVDTNKFRPVPYDEQLAETLRIEKNECVIVYAGSIVNYEGIDDVISATRILRDRGVPVRFVVVGDGVMRAELTEQTKRLDLASNVSFVGRIAPEQVSRYISIATVLPIARKPFRVCQIVSPLKPFEAMAMEKAVVVSDLAALREIVIDGETGLICEPANPESLADKIAQLHHSVDLTNRIGRTAREWVAKNRSWDSHASKLSDVYEDLGRRVPA